jgi:transposase
MLSTTCRDPGDRPCFPPVVAMHAVKIACELPDKLGRSLSQWDSHEIASQLVSGGVVDAISHDTVWRILNNHRLKPWRQHMWLSSNVPRDEAFVAQVQEIVDLYTRPLAPYEAVLCTDEKTSLQPRTRKAPTKPARPGDPVRVEHEYTRKGALNLHAAFDTRTGKVYGQCHARKRQVEFIQLLEELDRELPAHLTLVHVILDNVSVHKGKLVKKWLEEHPRFRFHFLPVHCSWMDQVEQWFSILQRKRFSISDFESTDDLRAKVMAFIAEYNQHAHPFNWNTKSAAKVMAWAERKRDEYEAARAAA